MVVWCSGISVSLIFFLVMDLNWRPVLLQIGAFVSFSESPVVSRFQNPRFCATLKLAVLSRVYSVFILTPPIFWHINKLKLLEASRNFSRQDAVNYLISMVISILGILGLWVIWPWVFWAWVFWDFVYFGLGYFGFGYFVLQPIFHKTILEISRRALSWFWIK